MLTALASCSSEPSTAVIAPTPATKSPPMVPTLSVTAFPVPAAPNTPFIPPDIPTLAPEVAPFNPTTAISMLPGISITASAPPTTPPSYARLQFSAENNTEWSMIAIVLGKPNTDYVFTSCTVNDYIQRITVTSDANGYAGYSMLNTHSETKTKASDHREQQGDRLLLFQFSIRGGCREVRH